MNVFELSHQVNDRLNGGDESKFSITLAIVNEILYYRKMVFSFKESVNLISRGDFDERISYIIDLENELKRNAPTTRYDQRINNVDLDPRHSL